MYEFAYVYELYLTGPFQEKMNLPLENEHGPVVGLVYKMYDCK